MEPSVKRNLLFCLGCLWSICYLFLLGHYLVARAGSDQFDIHDNRTVPPLNFSISCEFFLSVNDNHEVQLCENDVVRICSIQLDSCCNTIPFLDLTILYKNVHNHLAPVSSP